MNVGRYVGEWRKSTPSPTRGAVLAGVRIALASVTAIALANLFSLSHGYWVVMTMIVVMKAGLGATLLTSYQRILGTALGVVLGIPILLLLQPYQELLYVGLFLGMFAFGYYASRSYTVMVTVLTVVVFILFTLFGHELGALYKERLLDTIVGTAVGTGFSLFVLPDLARYRLAREHAVVLRACGVFFRNIVTLLQERETIRNMDVLSRIEQGLATCGQTLREGRHEPGSGLTLEAGTLVDAHLDRAYNELLHLKGAVDICLAHCPHGKVPDVFVELNTIMGDFFDLTADLLERKVRYPRWQEVRGLLRKQLYEIEVERVFHSDTPAGKLPMGLYLQHLRALAIELSGCGDAYERWLQTHEPKECIPEKVA